MDIPLLWYTLKGFGSDVAMHNIPFILSHSAQWVHVCTGGLWCTRVCVLNLSGYWSMKTPYIFSGIFSQFGVFICNFYGKNIDMIYFRWFRSIWVVFVLLHLFNLLFMLSGLPWEWRRFCLSRCWPYRNAKYHNNDLLYFVAKTGDIFQKEIQHKKKTNLQILHLAEFFSSCLWSKTFVKGNLFRFGLST